MQVLVEIPISASQVLVTRGIG